MASGRIKCCVLGLGAVAAGLLASPSTVHAQAVQLPSFHYFTVSTSVLVPDRGGAYLGGISRSQTGSVSRGVPLLGKVPGADRLFRNQGIAASQSASGVSVHATIIDNAELDRAVLAAAADRPSGLDPQIAGRAAFLARHVAQHPPATGELPAEPAVRGKSLDQLQREQEAARERRQKDAQQWLDRARQAEAAGKLGAARVYYQMAARSAGSAPAPPISSNAGRR
ncbi:MAG: hypothetical protein J5I93_01420 [Pirellulaceae bacterium]|nr:hypothetical protein [Pirellulaceae bacterium]